MRLAGCVLATPLTTATLAAASPASHGAGGPTDTAARRRLGELLQWLDRDDPEALVTYARDGFATDDGGAIDALAELRDQTGGIEPLSVDAAGAEATAQGRAKLTEDRVALRVRVEPQPPYRVTWFGAVRPAPSHEPPESAGRIMVRHLLSHTSGLGDHVDAMARDPFRTRYRSVDRIAEVVRRRARHRRQAREVRREGHHQRLHPTQAPGRE